MATVTPNIGLTKPAGTENVNLTVINENYDKIDAAVGQNATEVAKLTELFKIVSYTYTISRLNAYANKTITKANFGISYPDGYTPLTHRAFNTGHLSVAVKSIDVASDNNVFTIINRASSAIDNLVVSIDIVYVKTGVL